MGRGDTTKHTILRAALGEASLAGLEALSIGGLAKSVGMSKSGLFAHFGSKEGLQVAVLDYAATLFARRVVVPAIDQPRGLPRLVAIYENWVEWTHNEAIPGGCIFMSAAGAFEDRPGAVRELLAERVGQLRATLERAARLAVDEGHFRAELDTGTFAFSLHGLMLSHHIEARLFHNPHAAERSRAAFDALINSSRR